MAWPGTHFNSWVSTNLIPLIYTDSHKEKNDRSVNWGPEWLLLTYTTFMQVFVNPNCWTCTHTIISR